MVNVGLATFFLVTLKTAGLLFVPLSFVMHKVLQIMGKKDPFLRRIYLIYMRQADRYEPWPEKQPKRARRPTNIGSGIVG
jgi:type IV secretory pathway VirB3-like protein